MMNHCGTSGIFALPLYKNTYSHTLLNIKDILVLCAVRCMFLLLAVAMQVKHVNFVEALHEALAHSPECGIIEVAMIGDEGQNAITGLLNTVLSKTDEFYIVIV